MKKNPPSASDNRQMQPLVQEQSEPEIWKVEYMRVIIIDQEMRLTEILRVEYMKNL